MKNSTKLFGISLLALAGIGFVGANEAINSASSGVVTNAQTEDQMTYDLTNLSFSNTPVGGWGDINVNLDCTGAPLVVNGVTYSKGFGLHVHDSATETAADMAFDISALSNQYEYFEAQVAQPDGGNNCIRFTVLVDGVEKDSIVWRKGFGDGNPYYLRCSIKNASTLTLRTLSTGFGFANGTSAWLNPKLYNVNSSKVYVSDILNRQADTYDTGWGAYLGGDIVFSKLMFDQRVNGTSFSTLNPYGEVIRAKKGIGTQLRGSNFNDYSANKADTNLFTGFHTNITDKNYRLFNATVIMGAGSGCYVEAFADGELKYTSPLIDSSNAGQIINVDIPEGTCNFELKVIPASGIADGLVDILNAAFYTRGAYLDSYYSVDTIAPEFAFPVAHGKFINGDDLYYYDSVTTTDIKSERGLYIHKNGSYVFDVAGVNYNTLSGKIAAVSSEKSAVRINSIKITTIDNEGNEVVYNGTEFIPSTGPVDFKVGFNKQTISKIKIELAGDLANSGSVIIDPLLSLEAPIFVSASVTTGLEKTTYYVDETVDFTNVVVTAYYSDGSSAVIPHNELSFTGYDMSKAGDTTVNIYYNENVIATIQLNVIVDNRIVKIQVLDFGKTTYEYGEDLDLTTLVVAGFTKDEAPTVLGSDTYEVTGYNKTTLGEQTLTITYDELTTTTKVNVVDKVSAIELLTPFKDNYEIGENLDITDGMIKVTKLSGATENVNISETMVSGFDSSIAGTVTLTITYENKSITFDVTINSKAETSSSEEILSSSEIVSSSEIIVSSETSSSSQKDPWQDDKEKGCLGSIGTSFALVSLISLIGVGLLAGKKHQK